MIDKNKFYPVCEPCIDGNEKKYLEECIDSGWISSEGPFVEKFERGYSKYINVKHGITVSSGTAALETALYALGVKAGDEVIMPAFTIISCAIACIRLGAVPVFVDIDQKTLNIDVSSIESKITERTRVIMPVHMYGHPVDMDPLMELKDKYGVFVLEDAAEAHGAEYYSRHTGDGWYKCGGIGDIAATSFYANKIITTGEGGMVLTNNDLYAERARSYRNLCFGKEDRFSHTAIGYNFRFTNMQAAIGLAQLENIEKYISIKREHANLYKEYLSDVPQVCLMAEEKWAKSVYWMHCVIMESRFGIDAKEMIARLIKRNIGARPFFKGLHKQEPLQNKSPEGNNSYPVTDYASQYGFYLPSSITLNERDIRHITNIFKEEIKSYACFR